MLRFANRCISPGFQRIARLPGDTKITRISCHIGKQNHPAAGIAQQTEIDEFV